MAKKEAKEAIKLERIYNVPLRREWLKCPLYQRAEKAIRALKKFLAKHMKTDVSKVRIGHYLNLKIWERGMRFPPHHVKIVARKNEEGIVTAELEGAPLEEKREEPKKAAKAGKETAEAKEKKLEEKAEVKEAETVKEERTAEMPRTKEKVKGKTAVMEKTTEKVSKKEIKKEETKK